jgi:membrane protease YdiL (CAAX protease family)
LIVVGIGWLIMLPLVIGVASSGDFRGVYPLDREALRSHEMFWVYEAGYMSFFVGWEFFFRGFLLFALEPFFGPAAIVVQMIPFALLHFGKPVLEALGSIIAGLFLGALAWRTRSIWYGVTLHALVAVTMDLYVYFRWGLNP